MFPFSSCFSSRSPFSAAYATATSTLLGFVIFLSASVLTPGVARAEEWYRTAYKDVQASMRRLQSQYPERVRIVGLGESDSGAGIEGVAIGSGSIKNLIVAAHHGNEYGSTEVAMGFASSVAEAPIPGQTVYVVPVLNTSGFDQGDRGESTADGLWHDPNRDYPGPCGTEGPFNLKSTAALAKFVDTEGIVASATLHTYYPAVVYPWGFSTHDFSTPYDGLFKILVGYATEESHYQTGNSTELVYAADGTYEDYAFWKHGVWSLLFELGQSHSPSQAQVKEMIRVNVPGLRRFLAQAPAQRAEKHEFTGQCDFGLKRFDRHDE